MSSVLSAQQYKLVWEDNFDKNTLDESKWTIASDGYGGGNKELQYYKRENIHVGKELVSGENCLIITAKKEKYKSKHFTSGRICSQNKVTFRYGKIEARIKLPKTANGLWPAFWMMGVDYPKAVWPSCGEIDILEMGHKKGILAGTQDRYFNGACHWGTSWNGGSYPNKGVPTTNNYSLQDDFHLYTLIWNEDSIKMYLDSDKFPSNQPYFEMPVVANNDANSTANFFRKPYYVIFNLAVGGTFSELYTKKEITALQKGEAKMYIDYIKLYQKGKSTEELSQLNPAN